MRISVVGRDDAATLQCVFDEGYDLAIYYWVHPGWIPPCMRQHVEGCLVWGKSRDTVHHIAEKLKCSHTGKYTQNEGYFYVMYHADIEVILEKISTFVDRIELEVERPADETPLEPKRRGSRKSKRHG